MLVRYGFSAPVAAAGLLHAAYTHGAVARAETADALFAAIGALLTAEHRALDRRVVAYTQWLSAHVETPGERGDLECDADVLATLSIPEAETLAIVAANEADLHLSGELAATGRSDEIDDATLRQIEHVCAVLGVPGLHRTLARARARLMSAPAVAHGGPVSSYRLAADGRTPVPMARSLRVAAVGG